MGNLAELRGIVFVISSLSFFFITIAFIPSGFYQNQNPTQLNEMIDLDIPETYRAYEITVLNYSETYYLNCSELGLVGTNRWADFTLGGWDIQFRYIQDPTLNEYRMMVYHQSKWWIFIIESHGMKWYDKEGYLISQELYGDPVCYPEKIIDKFDENGFAKFRVECQHFGMDIVLHYNTTEYSNFFEAFKDNQFEAVFGINPHDLNTKLSAWDLIGKLLFFQMPNIHPILNMLIAIPIWTCIAYLIYVLILKVIPFVGD